MNKNLESLITEWKLHFDKNLESLIAAGQYEEINGDDWVVLLKRDSKFAEYCDWGKLKGYNWGKLLWMQPQFAEHCDWSKMNGGDWRLVLSWQPQFAEHCDWNKLNGSEWRLLLPKQPQFAEHCDWNKLNGIDWVELLSQQPQFAEHCDWNKLNGRDWVELLSQQPQFAEHCDWNKLNGRDWVELLSWKPKFSAQCEWCKLAGDDWGKLLSRHPQFAEQCNWNLLNRMCLADLFHKQPQLFKQLNDWLKIKYISSTLGHFLLLPFYLLFEFFVSSQFCYVRLGCAIILLPLFVVFLKKWICGSLNTPFLSWVKEAAVTYLIGLLFLLLIKFLRSNIPTIEFQVSEKTRKKIILTVGFIILVAGTVQILKECIWGNLWPFFKSFLMIALPACEYRVLGIRL